MRKISLLIVVVMIILSLFGCTKAKSAEDYLNENDYKSAYQLYLKDSDSSNADTTLVKWYSYCMQSEMVDEDLLAISIEDNALASRIFMEIKSYLFAKMAVDEVQSDVVYQLLVHNEELLKSESCYELLKPSLKMRSSSEFGWDVPMQDEESYDQYHTIVHNYTYEDVNKCVDKEGNQVSVLFDDFGMIAYTLNADRTVKSQQYVLYGNFKAGQLIGNDGLFDGYWVYYVKDLKDLCRIGLNGEMQTIISEPDNATYLYTTSLIVDHRLLFFVGQDNSTGKTTIHRIYLPSLDHKEYMVDDSRYEYATVDVPTDSEHIKFYTDNAEYIDLLNKYNNEDKDLLYSILSKYMTIDKDYVNDNDLFRVLYYDSEPSQIIRKVIKANYGIVNRIEHNLDVITGNDIKEYVDMAIITNWQK